MKRMVPQLLLMPSPETNFQEWEALAGKHHPRWQKYVKAALEAAVGAREQRVQSGKGHEQLEQPVGQRHFCYECGRDFSTPQGLWCHAAKQHGHKCRIRDYIASDVCPACAMVFHTRERCIKHVAYAAPRCKAAVLEHLRPLPPEEVAELELTEAKARKTVRKTTGSSVFAEKPCFRLIGPPQCGRGLALTRPDVFPHQGPR